MPDYQTNITQSINTGLLNDNSFPDKPVNQNEDQAHCFSAKIRLGWSFDKGFVKFLKDCPARSLAREYLLNRADKVLAGMPEAFEYFDRKKAASIYFSSQLEAENYEVIIFPLYCSQASNPELYDFWHNQLSGRKKAHKLETLLMFLYLKLDFSYLNPGSDFSQEVNRYINSEEYYNKNKRTESDKIDNHIENTNTLNEIDKMEEEDFSYF
ncbi:MAG: hypothetical protein HQL46_12315 [Gammaproteobacteria bacterium]|nr:hypothetical protein [Gammaproteobacteria bacterium]